MPNPTTKHQRYPVTNNTFVTDVLGVNTSTAVASTAVSTVASSFVVTNKPMSSSFLIQLFSYSYDGVVHTDSYRSDI